MTALWFEPYRDAVVPLEGWDGRRTRSASGTGGERGADGDPRAAYMVLDIPDNATLADWDWTATLTFWRVAYPIAETQGIMRSLNFPQRLISRLELGL